MAADTVWRLSDRWRSGSATGDPYFVAVQVGEREWGGGPCENWCRAVRGDLRQAC